MKFKLVEGFDVTQSDIEAITRLAIETFGKDTPFGDYLFITPEGIFLNIANTLRTHDEFGEWLQSHNFNIEADGSIIAQTLSYIRCNSLDTLCYAELPQKVTSKQLSSLREWLRGISKYNQIEIDIHLGDKLLSQEYNLEYYSPSKIIGFIRKAYTTGELSWY